MVQKLFYYWSKKVKNGSKIINGELDELDELFISQQLPKMI